MKIKTFLLNADELNDDKIYSECFHNISDFRKNKINSFKFRKDKNLSLAASILLNKALNAVGEKEKNISYAVSDNGKPYIKGLPDFHFNISHSNQFAVCSVYNKEIGCDIEKVQNIDLKIAKRFFAQEEYIYILNQKQNIDAFFNIWTLKESFIKAIAKGLALPLDSFSVIDDDKVSPVKFNNKLYHFKEYDFPAGYKTACCCEENNFENDLITISLL